MPLPYKILKIEREYDEESGYHGGEELGTKFFFLFRECILLNLTIAIKQQIGAVDTERKNLLPWWLIHYCKEDYLDI